MRLISLSSYRSVAKPLRVEVCDVILQTLFPQSENTADSYETAQIFVSLGSKNWRNLMDSTSPPSTWSIKAMTNEKRKRDWSIITTLVHHWRRLKETWRDSVHLPFIIMSAGSFVKLEPFPRKGQDHSWLHHSRCPILLYHQRMSN